MIEDSRPFPHDEHEQAFEDEGALLVALVDETYGVGVEETWPAERERFRQWLEAEYGQRFEDGNIGPGADFPAFLTLLFTNVEVPAWLLVSGLFFKGKPILDNLEAWPKIARMLRRFRQRRAYLNRQGAAAVAVDAIMRELPTLPGSLRLLSYRALHAGEDVDLAATERSTAIAEPLATLHLGFISHLLEIEADDQLFRVRVEGTTPTLQRLER